MCLLAIAWHVDPQWPLLVAANRDEFLARPARPLHRWHDPAGLIGGRDLQAGGTWMAACGRGPGAGRWAALTNLRRPGEGKTAVRSRGELVVRALQEPGRLSEVATRLTAEASAYDGFNLLLGDHERLLVVSSNLPEWQELRPGIHALSNGAPDDDWPKVRSARRKMAAYVAQPATDAALAGLLDGRMPAADHVLPATGVPGDIEKALSSEFIALSDYGTRAMTGLRVDRTGRLTVLERSVAGVGNEPPGDRLEEAGNFWPNQETGC